MESPAALGAGEPHSQPFFGLRLSGGSDQTSGVARLREWDPGLPWMMDEGKEGCSEKSRASEGRGGGKKCSCRQKGRRQRKGVFRETKLNLQLPCFLMVRPLWCFVTFYPNLW